MTCRFAGSTPRQGSPGTCSSPPWSMPARTWTASGPRSPRSGWTGSTCAPTPTGGAGFAAAASTSTCRTARTRTVTLARSSSESSTGPHERARDTARRTFGLLAAAEGAVHGGGPAEVHFHEVGAYDALAAVVGVVAAADDLGLVRPEAQVVVSALAVGSGTVHAQHGALSVPAPAVVALAAQRGLELTGGDLVGERSTPTGVALVAALADPGTFPAMTLRAVGTGGGSRETADRPNITRVVVGVPRPADGSRCGEAVVLEATVDDLDPQLWPSVLDAVRAAGDVVRPQHLGGGVESGEGSGADQSDSSSASRSPGGSSGWSRRRAGRSGRGARLRWFPDVRGPRCERRAGVSRASRSQPGSPTAEGVVGPIPTPRRRFPIQLARCNARRWSSASRRPWC